MLRATGCSAIIQEGIPEGQENHRAPGPPGLSESSSPDGHLVGGGGLGQGFGGLCHLSSKRPCEQGHRQIDRAARTSESSFPEPSICTSC